jgi:hypothetical protein
LIATIPLLVITLVLGIFPGILLHPINATLTHIVDLLKLP